MSDNIDLLYDSSDSSDEEYELHVTRLPSRDKMSYKDFIRSMSRGPSSYFTMLFGATRDVTPQDFLNVIEKLKEKGHKVRKLRRHEGGISFIDPGKDVRFSWYHFTHGIKTDPHHDSWHMKNRFGATFDDSVPGHPFTKAEIDDTISCIVSELGAVEDVIYNENRYPNENDSADAKSQFYGIDYSTALYHWTIKNPEAPNSEESRLFNCMKCRKWCHYKEFDSHDFGGVLRRYAWCYGTYCTQCKDKPYTSKRMIMTDTKEVYVQITNVNNNRCHVTCPLCKRHNVHGT